MILPAHHSPVPGHESYWRHIDALQLALWHSGMSPRKSVECRDRNQTKQDRMLKPLYIEIHQSQTSDCDLCASQPICLRRGYGLTAWLFWCSQRSELAAAPSGQAEKHGDTCLKVPPLTEAVLFLKRLSSLSEGFQRPSTPVDD